MKKTEKMFRLLMACCILMLGLCLLPVAVQAAQQKESIVDLKANRKYKTYDLTGDGKEDTLKVITSGATDLDDANKNIAVWVNGKKVYRLTNTRFYGVTLKLVTLKNGTPYLYLRAMQENDDATVCALLQWKSGKLTAAVDFQAGLKECGRSPVGEITKISGNKLKTRIYLMSWSLGPTYLDYTYTYKNGTLKQASSYGTLRSALIGGKKVQRLTAGKNITVCTKPGSSAKAFTVKKGKQVKTTGKCWMKNDSLYFQVKYYNRTGWIKNDTTWPDSVEKQQFSNVTFVG